MARKDYEKEAIRKAWDCVEAIEDTLIEQWNEDRECDKYPDRDDFQQEFHRSGDQEYPLREAAALMDDLHDYLEDDEGLWQGLEPRKAIEAQACYTYRNAVRDFVRGAIESLNEDLAKLYEAMGTEEHEDRAAIDAAGARLIRLWILFRDRDHSEFDDSVGSIYQAAISGDHTTAKVLADKIEDMENGDSRLARSIRNAVN